MPRAASQNVIHCANCLHCKTFLRPLAGGKLAEKRVRCKRGHWAGTSACRYVLNRMRDACDDYNSMGEADKADFLTDLSFNLPSHRQHVILRRKPK